MKHIDICSGDVITLRNGKKYIALLNTPLFGSILVNENGSIGLNGYDQYLRSKRDVYNKPWGEEYDIVKIERPASPKGFLDVASTSLMHIWDEETEPLIPEECLNYIKNAK